MLTLINASLTILTILNIRTGSRYSPGPNVINIGKTTLRNSSNVDTGFKDCEFWSTSIECFTDFE